MAASSDIPLEASVQGADAQAGAAVPPASVLVSLTEIGKDYPVFRSHASKLKTVFELLTGQAVQSYHRALTGLNLTIRQGESWGIIGENGAGKSTLLKIIAGVVRPSHGTRVVNGRLSALLELGTGFHPEYSGRENIYLASALMGWTRAETHAHLDAILEFADIGDHIDQPIKTYSTGMVVRLGFAVATSLKPDLLVTDEVLAVGDESFQKKCLRWMENYRAGGGALLLCSHSMYHIQSLCQNAIWIHHGRSHMMGEAYAVTQAYLAYHEEKNAREGEARPASDFQALYPCLESVVSARADGTACESFASGDDILIVARYHSPDDRPTVVMTGVTRIDGTPVYGTFSNDAGYETPRVGTGLFEFRYLIRANPLLPGKYKLKAHTLDEHGLRLFDSMAVEITVTGKTRDHGLVRLEHEWQ